MQTKVLIVIGQLETGGTERHLLNILPALNRAGIEVSIYAMRGGGALESLFEAAGVRVISPQHHSRRVIGLIRTAVHLLASLWRLRPQIVHYFLPEAYLLAGSCALLAPSYCELMSRRSLNYYQAKWPSARLIERQLHRRLWGALANSQAVRRDLLDEGIEAGRLAVISNGVALPSAIEVQPDKLRADLDIAQDVVVIVVVANLIPYKGHSDILQALALLNEKTQQPWHVAMLGSGDLAAALEKQTASLSLTGRVSWLGAVADVRTYLRNGDFAVLASHEEGFSNAILEAMSESLAVIATSVGGNSEAVIDGETGIIVPPRDPEKLAEALLTLLGDPNLRARMGAAGRKRIEEEYSMDACIEAYRRLYLSTRRVSKTNLQAIVDGAF